MIMTIFTLTYDSLDSRRILFREGVYKNRHSMSCNVLIENELAAVI